MEIPKYSLGIGDRFGRQGRAQLAALLRARDSGIEIAPVWNKSHREHTIIGTRPGEFKADRNNIPRVWCDHGAWPLMVLRFYIHQTGDTAILQTPLPYWKDQFAAPHTYTAAPIEVAIDPVSIPLEASLEPAEGERRVAAALSAGLPLVKDPITAAEVGGTAGGGGRDYILPTAFLYLATLSSGQ